MFLLAVRTSAESATGDVSQDVLVNPVLSARLDASRLYSDDRLERSLSGEVRILHVERLDRVRTTVERQTYGSETFEHSISKMSSWKVVSRLVFVACGLHRMDGGVPR